jgi:quinohemoprotein ethanol dehydrogenase
MIDGVLYAAGPWGSVFAVDGRTGEEKWRYDPDVDGSYNRRACCDVVNRGLAAWRGKIYVGTLDGYLVALDAASGEELWKVDTLIERDRRFRTITSPPQVAKNVVVIGNSGGDYGVRGYVTAYDLETGAEKWRFFTVPRDPGAGAPEHPEMRVALETWGPDTDWESGLGGTAWGEMVYDPQLNLLYVGTGNSTPYSGWHRDPSRGDNLFLVSILAIDPDNGRLKWHYQQVPWELWDYTATMNMILADPEIDGRKRKVLMQAPKNGFFYILDRETGEFISASPFVFQNWNLGFDAKGRPAINPDAIYQRAPKLVFPSSGGAHGWQPMAYNPDTGLVYIPAREQGMVIFDEADYRWKPGTFNAGSGAVFSTYVDFLPPELESVVDDAIPSTPGLPSLRTREMLIAWDPVAQKERWRVPTGDDDYAGGGVLTTSGNLVIQGTASGYLRLYRADTGVKVHEIEVGTGIMAAPISYEVDGEQYVAVLAGFGGALAALWPEGAMRHRQNYGRLLAFKLGGGRTPLPPLRVRTSIPRPPDVDWYSDELADAGRPLFDAYCAVCHGGRGEAQLSSYPDLHVLRGETHATFDAIVLDGPLAANGMASFRDVLSPEQARMIHAHLLREQRLLYEDQPTSGADR